MASGTFRFWALTENFLIKETHFTVEWIADSFIYVRSKLKIDDMIEAWP